MVEEQLAARGITDVRVLEVMRKVPRHLFVPKEHEASAYADHPIHIGTGQTISQPYIVALMTQMLEPMPDRKILEIGTGSGYQTAILAELAGHVWTIERHESLAVAARQRLNELGYKNFNVIIGDGSIGYADAMPYDGIIVTAAGPQIPSALKEQLAVGGRLVCPIGARETQKLLLVRRDATGFTEEEGIGCVFVPLIGKYGWQNG